MAERAAGRSSRGRNPRSRRGAGGDAAPIRVLSDGPRPEAAPWKSFDVKGFMNAFELDFVRMVKNTVCSCRRPPGAMDGGGRKRKMCLSQKLWLLVYFISFQF